MDKNAIKKYAVWARRELISRVSQRAAIYGITDEGYGDPNAADINGKILTDTEKKQRQALIAEIRSKGYEQVMEEVAYTWFNRFIALRFMEVNGYLPSHVRVFTDDENNFKPQILTEAINLEFEGLDMEKVFELKNANDNDELFKYLIIVQCNDLNAVLPDMFQKLEDYTELLFPDNILRDGSVIEQMIIQISEESWLDQVQIIGWLYQYYISEKHAEVIDPLHGKTVEKDEIPAATQLFTPDWVVKYLVDNSLGRFWIDSNPNSIVKNGLKYYVQTEGSTVEENCSPEEITVLDPCVGSGHFLVYAFDVLMEIYKEYGYNERDAASAIITNNLFGLDIDSRAVQIAQFAVMMKARQYDRRFLSKGIQPNIHTVVPSNKLDCYTINHFCNSDTLKAELNKLICQMKDADEYGSMISISEIDFHVINNRVLEIENEISIYQESILRKLVPIIKAAQILANKYTIVVTNPPYLNKMSEKLKNFVNKQYKDYAGDLFSVFIYRNFKFCKRGGFSAFMTPNVWMFIKTYEKLRKYVLDNKSLVTLIQMAKGAFFKEATVDVTAFVLKNDKTMPIGVYFRLDSFKGDMDYQNEKILDALNAESCAYKYETDFNLFYGIEGMPIAYWINERTRKMFNNQTLKEVASPCIGMRTGDNARFLRFWYEVDYSKVGIGYSSALNAKASGLKWFPYNKGGAFRRWYGNNELIVNWESDGLEIKKETKKRYPMLGDNLGWKISNEKYYFMPSITWSDTTSAAFSGRYSNCGALFDVKGSSCFPSEDIILYTLGLLNTKVTQEIISILNPTITTQVGDMARIPIMIDENNKDIVDDLVEQNIIISKNDWNSFETSWDFSINPMIRKVSTVSEAYNIWEQDCKKRFTTLKANEEKLNSIFVEIYGLQGEMTSDIDDKDVTVQKSDLQREVKGLVSYAVGCMFGRYSLDESGLVYAGGLWNDKKYITYLPDADAILPICDDEYFEDDIVGRFVEFIRIVYGPSNLEENLFFIAEALGGRGTPREVIRKYFMNDFYKDHCKIYQKRPIYWLFDSGKKGGFKALIYMHRYQPDTIARIRTDYVHEQQSRYRTAIADVEDRMQDASTSERVKLNKKLKKLNEQAEEIRLYEEKIHHLADQMISIDLDDGVKHNYAIFQDVLAKIK